MLKDVKFGHPKFYKLQEILVTNFKDKDSTSRVIVFFEYRESVMEAYALLLQSKPLLKPRIFLGQKNGITQKSQINVSWIHLTYRLPNLEVANLSKLIRQEKPFIE